MFFHDIWGRREDRSLDDKQLPPKLLTIDAFIEIALSTCVTDINNTIEELQNIIFKYTRTKLKIRVTFVCAKNTLVNFINKSRYLRQ